MSVVWINAYCQDRLSFHTHNKHTSRIVWADSHHDKTAQNIMESKNCTAFDQWSQGITAAFVIGSCHDNATALFQTTALFCEQIKTSINCLSWKSLFTDTDWRQLGQLQSVGYLVILALLFPFISVGVGSMNCRVNESFNMERKRFPIKLRR